ncbi:MAG: hypothetical protein C3L25_01055 [Candidatus Sedimenticola endophacoides]|nr:MAG: hypothetical protein C3L26_01095 [Candidatus Sedimenticola endophacoides]PUE05386.1 MAG: hypothetical protein C3L25_01055 [Candidatus Sedimenticola endophacoides]
MNRKWNANTHLARIAWGIIMGIALWLMLFAFTGERFTPVRMASYLAPWMAALLLLITVAGIIAHRRRLAISALLLAFVVGYPYLGLLIPFRGVPASEAAVYKVMTYSKMGRNHDIAAVSRVVRSQQPDLLFMQEIGEGESAALIDQR